MKKNALGILLAACVLLGVMGQPVAAQTYLSTTTLSAAITTAAATVVRVTSATGMVVNGNLVVDREVMAIVSISGTAITVQRGASSTNATTHASGATTVVFPLNAMSTPPPVGGGTCTVANYQYLPIYDTSTGNYWLCRSVGTESKRWYATNPTAITYNSLLINLN